MEVEASDVIRLIQQFLYENGYSKTLSTFEEESSINMNIVKDKQLLQEKIEKGRWEDALDILNNISVDPKILIDLYEQIYIELWPRIVS